MDTIVELTLVDEAQGSRELEDRAVRAFACFEEVERAASRFRAGSEVVELASRVGPAVPLSPLLFELVRMNLVIARLTGGAFDPACGARLEAAGHDREYRSGHRVRMAPCGASAATYRDIVLDPKRRTVTLGGPVLLDLGASAKGLAIDLAARELRSLPGYAIDAGGDVRVGGRSPDGDAWRVGVRHPLDRDLLLSSVELDAGSICTSGSYERGSHIVDARTGSAANRLLSATVMSASAAFADMLSTAAYLLGPELGRRLLAMLGVRSLLVAPGEVMAA